MVEVFILNLGSFIIVWKRVYELLWFEKIIMKINVNYLKFLYYFFSINFGGIAVNIVVF